jgi:hypothetical protein
MSGVHVGTCCGCSAAALVPCRALRKGETRMELVLGLVVLLVSLLVVLTVLASLGWLVLAVLAGLLWIGRCLLRAAVRVVS